MYGEAYDLNINNIIRKKKREIPQEMKVSTKQLQEKKFCLSSSDITLLSYSAKKNKIILLASTYVNSTKIVDGKPEIIIYYNAMKVGTE